MTKWSLRWAMGGFALISAFALTACDILPRYPGRASDRMSRSGHFTVALANPSLRADPLLIRPLGEVERRSKARGQWHGGLSEAF